MCGITGFINKKSFDSVASQEVIMAMANKIAHRGPDDAGYWLNEEDGLAFGHRRLSIIDLSQAGHQPMMSESGNYVIIFNGEIYNHLEIRDEIAKAHWRGTSDTETLLAGIELWGLKKVLEKATGMFAIALWDKKNKTLSLARDRIGEKPLYYGWNNGIFFFGSELKSFTSHPSFAASVNIESLAYYAQHGFVSGVESIYDGIKRVVPGSIVVINANTEIVSNEPYWSLDNVVSDSVNTRFKGTAQEAIEELESLIIKSVSQQMLSDVSLGAFLSGGIDSSVVVSVMQSLSPTPVKTFTIGFGEQKYNEAPHAKAVADHLKTMHTELYINPENAMSVIPDLSDIYDEPFADASQIPTVLVSKLARQHVTVALSGDAGDELFCGYDRYSNVKQSWNKLSSVPFPLRRLAKFILPANRITNGLACANIEEFGEFINTQWKGDPRLVKNAVAKPVYEPFKSASLEPEERLMYQDTGNYLPDDLLVKVDRAAMFSSLETRVPFLDHKIVEFAWRLPLSIKRKGEINKWPLKTILYKHVPQSIINRPKMGFGVPLEHWLRGDLRPWAEDLLTEQNLKSVGFFDHKAIRKAWMEHTSGKYDRHYALWTILMFLSWFQKNKR
ncbi:MAG TPA: asparagine synthase (glutamine-hydrolyzing) [Niabella sp.]